MHGAARIEQTFSASGRRRRGCFRRRPASYVLSDHLTAILVSSRSSWTSSCSLPHCVDGCPRSPPSADAPVTAVVASGDHMFPGAATRLPETSSSGSARSQSRAHRPLLERVLIRAGHVCLADVGMTWPRGRSSEFYSFPVFQKLQKRFESCKIHRISSVTRKIMNNISNCIEK